MKGKVLWGLKNGLDLIQLGRHLRELVDSEFTLPLEKLNLKQMIIDAISIIKQKFSEKNIELEINVADTLHFSGEKVSFENMVLNNLLTNAIKFSFPGSKIIIDAQKNEEHITISIKDSGIGMSEKLLQNIFNFKQTTLTLRKGTNGEQGTGHGMPLVRKFVHAYGGTIEIFSREQSEGGDKHGTEVKIILKSAE
jgi:signal transduction histidine kinase